MGKGYEQEALILGSVIKILVARASFLGNNSLIDILLKERIDKKIMHSVVFDYYSFINKTIHGMVYILPSFIKNRIQRSPPTRCKISADI